MSAYVATAEPAAVPAAKDLSQADRTVLYFLTDEQAKNGGEPVEVSFRRMAVKTKLDVRTVQKSLRRLVEEGHVKVQKVVETSDFTSKPYFKTNQYSVTLQY